MNPDIFIGVDAGTSLIKSIAFSRSGDVIASASVPNVYEVLRNGGAEQDMARTWRDVSATLRRLGEKVPDLARRTAAIAVTGQGDGTWLIDADGEPVAPGWLWLDVRATDIADAMIARADYHRHYETTGTALNACQQSMQLAWLKRERPDILARATAALHCKDWLYFKLTGERATDPSEASFTYGDFRKRDYAPEILARFGIESEARLLPPIVDGARSAGEVVLNPGQSGYTMPFPGTGMVAQMQSNMAASLNVDWLADIARQALAQAGVEKPRETILSGFDDAVLNAPPAGCVYHPYISQAGERGPFLDRNARAQFVGLSQGTTFAGLLRGVYEGLSFAARDCYEAMGAVPREIHVAGGVAKSPAMRRILASVLGAPVRTMHRDEAGAAGAAMIAAVQLGSYPDMTACAAEWCDPHLGDFVEPDPGLAMRYDDLFGLYKALRHAVQPSWKRLAEIRDTAMA